MQEITVCSIASGAAAPAAQAMHRHSLATEIWWVSEGLLDIEAGTQRIALQPGELLLLPTGVWHRLCSEPSVPCSWHRAVVAVPDVGCGEVFRLQPKNPRYISSLFMELERLYPEDPGKSALIASLLLKEADQVMRHVPEALFMAPLQHELEETCHLPFSLEAAAQFAGMSKYHFSRKFKEACGLSPLQFVIHCRVARAEKLLKETSQPLSSIASACGYHSATQFHAVFTRIIGETPMRYRKAHQAHFGNGGVSIE